MRPLSQWSHESAMNILASGTEEEAGHSGHAIHPKVKILPPIPEEFKEKFI